jgi:phosphatidylinositol-3-phosphatase
MTLRSRLITLFVLPLAAAGMLRPGPAAAALPPAPKHIVIVFEENRDYETVVDDTKLATLQSLIRRGTLFTDSHAVTHPSLPNYFAIFTGRTNTDGDHCSDARDALGDMTPNAGLPALMPTLASELIAAHRTFVGYAEGLPSAGYVRCYGRGGSVFGAYYKRHAPWAFFTKADYPSQTATDAHGYLLDDGLDQPFSAFPAPGRYDDLPTVAMVTPNVSDDMHGTGLGGSSAQLASDGDQWLGANIVPLVDWASDPKNSTLVIITWDEGGHHAHGDTNHIPTLFLGAMVKQGVDAERITHYSVLATIERFYGLPAMTDNDRSAATIAQCWR